MAWFKRHSSKQAGLIFPSDRGSQYASQDFRGVLTEYGITASMCRRQAKDKTIAGLPWYSQTRLHSTLASVSPDRFEQDWLAAQAKQVNS